MIALYSWSVIAFSKALEPDRERYIVALATVALNLLAPNALKMIQGSFKDTIYEVEGKEIKIAQFYDFFKDLLTQNINFNNMCTAMDALDETTQGGIAAIMTGFLVTLMGKHVNKQCSDQYFFIRYSALGARVGAGGASAYLQKENIIPDKELCAEFYTTVAGQFEFRKTIFHALKAALLGSHPFKGSLNTAYMYLEYTEMSHIELIISQIIHLCPEIMSLKCLIVHQDTCDEAITFIKSKPEEERPYIKILYSQEETKCLSSNKYQFLLAAARSIASYYNSSYKNYLGGNNQIHSRLESIIHKYLSARIDHGVYAITDSTHAMMGDKEKEATLEALSTTGEGELFSHQRE